MPQLCNRTQAARKWPVAQLASDSFALERTQTNTAGNLASRPIGCNSFSRRRACALQALTSDSTCTGTTAESDGWHWPATNACND